MKIIQLALALLCWATLATTATAEMSLSLGGGITFDKHEFQDAGGSASPHFSLNGQGRVAQIDLTRSDAFEIAGRPIAASLSLHFNDAGQVDTANNGRGWTASLDRSARVRTTRALVTLSTPIAQRGDWSLDLGVGLGIASIDVILRHGTATAHQRDTLPHAAISLRAGRTGPDGRTRIWSELRYRSSPALALTYSDGERRRHELSGLELAAGITFFFE